MRINTFTYSNTFYKASAGVFIISLISTFTIAQPEFGLPSEPGKCYAKCLIADQYETTSDSFPVYSNIENVAYDIEEIELHPATQKWVQKRADRNCLNEDPNDCLVWRLVEIEELTKEIKIPEDPHNAGELTYEVYELKTLIKEGGFTEWREVVCANNITKDLITKIQDALFQEGYQVGQAKTKKIDPVTMASIVEYQKDNDLPVGQLDLETLAELRIRIN